MASVSGVGRPAVAAAGRARGGVAGAGFALPPEAGTAAEPAGAASPASLGAMLALQEVSPEPLRDQAARRHGEALLRLLAALQRAGLAREGEGDGAATLAELDEMVRRVPDAADPALRSAVAAVALRVRVELARGRS